MYQSFCIRPEVVSPDLLMQAINILNLLFIRSLELCNRRIKQDRERIDAKYTEIVLYGDYSIIPLFVEHIYFVKKLLSLQEKIHWG